MVRRGDRKAKTVRKAQSDLYRLLSATQLGITITSILLGFVAEDTVAHLFRDWFATLPQGLAFLTRGGIASVVAVAAVSFLHVVFGELAPKRMALSHPESFARWLVPPLGVFEKMVRPFTATLNWSANGVLRVFGENLRPPTTADIPSLEQPAGQDGTRNAPTTPSRPSQPSVNCSTRAGRPKKPSRMDASPSAFFAPRERWPTKKNLA